MPGKEILKKLKKLETEIRRYSRIAVAFSGGTDSSLLCFAASKVLGSNMAAVSVETPFTLKNDIKSASVFAARYNIRHSILKIQQMESVITENTRERCYLCKRLMMNKIISFASSHGFSVVADGSNIDDTGDFRPGMKATAELGIVSPLMQANFSKADIIEACRHLGLDIEETGGTCLATRVPFGTKLETSVLLKIEECEDFLHKAGFKNLRVRYHNDIARIELEIADVKLLLSDDILRENTLEFFKKRFRFVTVDIEGIRRGSMN